MRSQRGSVIVLIGAITLGIVLAILFFGLNYVRMLGAHEQQRTAIEAAALAAAGDLTNIVVDDPNFGLVSLSDVVPKGKNTQAGDNYDSPVIGLNTLIATVRLDMIIADQFNDQVMQRLVQRDYTNALAAKDLLEQALKAAIQGGTGVDADGNILNPQVDALAAYNKNSVRMLGPNKCTLVPNSLKLKLGCISNEPTSTAIPQPVRYSQLVQSQQQNGFYLPYVNAPYGNKDFVFVATSSDVHLVDNKNVQDTINGLPYQIPTIVICEADEVYRHTDNYGRESINTIHSRACAEPACMVDNMPAPGSLQLTFPNGRPTQLTALKDLLNLISLNASPADYVMTPTTGDSPPAIMTPLVVVPGATTHPNFGIIVRVCLYDWIRRARTKPNLEALARGFSQAFTENVPMKSSHALYLDFGPDGSIMPRCQPINPDVYAVVGQNQYFAATGLALHDNAATPTGPITSYDVFIKDYAYMLGRIKGGKHAGEPFANGGALLPASAMFAGAGWISEGVTEIEAFPVGGGIRPTYDKSGTAVEIIARVRS